MFSDAQIPVVQFSLHRSPSPHAHCDLGRRLRELGRRLRELRRRLRELRRQGILIVGSGNIVHYLQRINWDGGTFDWPLDFDDTMRCLILAGEFMWTCRAFCCEQIADVRVADLTSQ